MNTFHGQVAAGNNVNVANGDINIYENNERYTNVEQWTPDEMRQRGPTIRQRLKQRAWKRRIQAPFWMILPAAGFFLGLYAFTYHVQPLIGGHFNIFRIAELLTYFTKQYTPIVSIIVPLVYIFGLWVLPIAQAWWLLFKDDEVMARQRKTLHKIKILLEERG